MLYVVACFAGVSAVFAFGAYSSARSAIDSLRQEWEFLHREGGYSFERAIGRGTDPSDSPLKETWESASQAVANLHPFQSTTNLLQVLCFVIAPLVFFTYGAIAATRDAHYKTLKFRAVREGRQRLFVSQAVSLVLVVAALTAAAFCIALLISVILHLAVSGRVDTRGLEVPKDMMVTGPLPTMAMMFGTGVIFAFLGMSMALIIGRPLYVVPVFLAGFFLVPVLGRFDPRNLLMAVAYPHLDFVGGFIPSAPRPVPEFAAVLLLVIGAAVLLVLTYVVRSRRSHYVT
ncbi:hypothetical protein [Streptomyces nodosus]|uniref:hypothetical protein n=1 Tax=Streptomyces nodosus TaxID=40318 RepID=UPI0037F98452